jgi:hypothetical protein
MSDPSEATQANPHPVSQHRTPREIAADEAGPIGQPDLDVVEKKSAAATTPEHADKRREPRAGTMKRGKRG